MADKPSEEAVRAKFFSGKDNDYSRFLLEIEFVELLANPHYLHYLAQQNYFKDQRFINYLNYLQYWSRPEYIQHLSHPHCLYFLELLQREEFRKKLLEPAYIDLLHNQQFWHWRHYRTNRYFEKQNALAAAEEEKQQQLQQQQQGQQEQPQQPPNQTEQLQLPDLKIAPFEDLMHP